MRVVLSSSHNVNHTRHRLLALYVVLTLTSLSCAPAPTAEVTKSFATDYWAIPPDQVVGTYGTDGMVVSTDRVGSEVGAEILRRGGNAVDAAVAVHFALAVVNPEAGNIGGGGFAVLRMDGEEFALDFREKAPLAATPNMFVDESGATTERSRVGHLAAGVPGSVAGMWELHRRFGTMPWSELIQPSIHLAEGFVVHERLASSLEQFESALATYASTAAVFLPGGSAPRVGDRLVQSDLAATLSRIATDGINGFYRGPTAELIVMEMENGGGLISRNDLLAYEAVWRVPIRSKYRDLTIVGMPPPSSGGVTLAELLNILQGFEISEYGFLSAEHAHLWTEAAKRAFSDRNAFLADPDFVPQPVEALISESYGAARRAGISLDEATPASDVVPGLDSPDVVAPRESENTTHYSIVDGEGNAVAVTTTINSLYGSLVTVAGAGFILNNEMDDFATNPGTPNQYGLVQGDQNSIEPEKRMLSSMSPTIVLDPDGQVRLVTGSPGGPTIITTVAQLISNVFDFDMELTAATAAPRLHHQHLPDTLLYERGGLTEEVISTLRSMGHVLEERDGFQGDTHSILIWNDGSMIGVSDPRKGGAAVGVRVTADVVQ